MDTGSLQRGTWKQLVYPNDMYRETIDRKMTLQPAAEESCD